MDRAYFRRLSQNQALSAKFHSRMGPGLPGGGTKLKHHLVGGHPRTANNRAVTAKERSRHKNAGKNGPNGRWPIGPFLRQVPIGDRDRSFAVTALSEAVATITAVITKVSFSNGAAQRGRDVHRLASPAILLVSLALASPSASAAKHLNGLNCATDEIARYDGNTWVCSVDNTVDLTTLIAQVALLQGQLNTLESEVDQEVLDRIASIDAEEAARMAADTSLQANIDAEATTRAAADTTLQANIDAETAARIAADNTLDADITALESNTVLGLDGLLSLGSVLGQPTALFEGVNVQIMDGTGSTISPPAALGSRGLGNLIIGYDETSSSSVCSVGPHLNLTDCTNAGADWDSNQKRGNHNLVLGLGNNYAQSAGAVFGLRNTVNRDYSTVTGGMNNVSAGTTSSITGGNDNRVGQNFAHISGGFDNSIPFTSGNGASVISGGSFNTNLAGEAVIGGGSGCTLGATKDLGWGGKSQAGNQFDCVP